MNTVEKLYLSVQVNNVNDDIQWNVETFYTSVFHDEEKNTYVFEFDNDYKKCTEIKINLLNKKNENSHILIKEVKIGEKVLSSINNWSIIKDNYGNIFKDTHGWFGVIGSCRLKIKYSPVTQNYINYFLDISR